MIGHYLKYIQFEIGKFHPCCTAGRYPGGLSLDRLKK
jgi:hypothetical protein